MLNILIFLFSYLPAPPLVCRGRVKGIVVCLNIATNHFPFSRYCCCVGFGEEVTDQESENEMLKCL